MSAAEQQADWSKAQREAELVGRVSGVHGGGAEEKRFKTKQTTVRESCAGLHVGRGGGGWVMMRGCWE